MKPSERADPDLDGRRFLEGVAQFNRGEYWRAHETWEAAWLASAGERKQFLQGLIQVAAACYHLERGNASGAARLIASALKRLDALPTTFGGIELAELREGARVLSSNLDSLARPPHIRMLDT